MSEYLQGNCINYFLFVDNRKGEYFEIKFRSRKIVTFYFKPKNMEKFVTLVYGKPEMLEIGSMLPIIVSIKTVSILLITNFLLQYHVCVDFSFIVVSSSQRFTPLSQKI